MSHRYAPVLFAFFVTVLALFSMSAVAQQPCERLSALALPHTTITLAKSERAGPHTFPSFPDGHPKPVSLPAFCRVAGTIKPTADSDIKFELWLPAKGWNERFQQEGNGGFAGSIVYSLMIPALKRGYATASTDDGHTGGGDPTWALHHPKKVIDFGYRAVHETAQASEAIVRAFYGHPARRDYFFGCSDGGREALMEAQRFPRDFNGIIAGAPANDWTHLLVATIWNEQATLDNPASYIPTSKLPLIQSAALAACDALDGVKDGVIEDPRRCHFDPSTLQCKSADTQGCLTAPQVEALKKIYAGTKDPRTGKQVFPGYPPGAEAVPGGWSAWIIGNAPGKAIQFFFGNGFFSDMVFDNPKWNFRTFNFDSDVSLTDSKLGPVLNSANPDLEPFKARGGKLIQYHGWADAAIAPMSSIDYYEKVLVVMRTKAGGNNPLKETQSFYRLFMVPGMEHCGGGPGANVFGNAFGAPLQQDDPEHDVVKALERWVEQGVAPEKIIATKYVDDKPAKGVARTRPLCSYPDEAQWTGKGSTNDAANFVCRLPR